MKAFLQKLTIKQKMRFGFALIWLVLGIITIQAAVNLALVRSNVSDIVEVKQPIAINSAQVAFMLEKSFNALSGYMLTGDEKLLKQYHEGIDEVHEHMNHSREMLQGLGGLSEKLNYEFELIDSLLEKIPPYIDRITEIQSSPALKFPAFAYVDENMMGTATEMQQIISQMVSSELNELSPHRRSLVEEVLNLQKAWLNVMSSLRGYVAFRNDAMSEATESYLNLTESLIDEIANQNRVELTLEEEDGIDKIQQLYQVYREHYMVLKGIHEGDQWRMDTWLMEHEIAPIFKQVDKELIKSSDIAVNDMLEESQALLDSSLNNIIILLLLSLVGIVGGLYISNQLAKSVLNPIEEIATAMKDISEGEGDLTRRLPVKSKDELAQLAGYFNDFVAKIQRMLQQIAETTRQLEISSGSLLSITNETKEGVNQQLASTTVLSESMVEMAKKSRSVVDHSENTSRATKQASDRVKMGGEKVMGTADEIQKLSLGMEEMTRSVAQLRDDSESIETVVHVIRDIAEQTNLLSLNAAIEAARAGEHGRGFAVVADEVRGLAQRTQESTAEIEEIIDKIRKATLTTVSVVESGQETTQQSCQAIAETKESLKPVMALMDDIYQMSEQMSNAAQSQSVLAQEINDNISQIHLVSERSASGAQNTESAGHDLQVLADKLERLVHQFKI